MGKFSDFIGRRKATVKDDLIAGLIVAIVALPLAVGFAIASNCPPAMGVYTAIIAGFIAAIFGGSDYQVSGPTGAMVVVILGVVAKYGIDGLIVATLIAGVLLILISILKLGKIIEYIPSPVIVGFTAGIGVIIFFGQINNFFGLSPVYPSGAEFIEKTFISFEYLFHSVFMNILPTLIISVLALLVLVYVPKINKRIPSAIVAVTITTLIVVLLPGFFDIKTVLDVGEIPNFLPPMHIPHLDWELIKNILPAALIIATLAAIESLLSAVVADGMTGTKHQPNKELMGQGFANIASALFGGMPATGAIARTATNIRNGAKTRYAAVFHAIFLLVFILLFAKYIGYIPLAALAAILMFVAFNMVEWERVIHIRKIPLSDAVVMAVTFLLTVLVDLTTAIEVGLVLAALLFMKRMSDLYKIEEFESQNETDEDKAIIKKFNHKDISIYTIRGPLFFGAASRFEQMVGNTAGARKPIKIIRMKHVPVIDATGLQFLESTIHKHKKMGGVVLFSRVHPDVMKIIRNSGLDKEVGEKHFLKGTKEALVHALIHSHRIHKEEEKLTEKDLELVKNMGIEKRIIDSASADIDPVEGILNEMGVSDIVKHVEKIKNMELPKPKLPDIKIGYSKLARDKYERKQKRKKIK